MNNPVQRTGRAIRREYCIRFLLIYALWGILFYLVGEWASGRTMHSLSLRLDEGIPFIPDFEYLYVLAYVLPFIPLFVVDDAKALDSMIAAFILMNVIAFSVFVAYPVYCPRPAFAVNSPATFLLRLEQSIDRPVNNFPSLHAGISWLLFLASRGYSRRVDVFMACSSLGIGVAALFVKQHYILDIFAGYLLAWVCHSVAYGLDVQALFKRGIDNRKGSFGGTRD